MTKYTTIEHLSNYLNYMKELGFDGLELQENPFLKLCSTVPEQGKYDKPPTRTSVLKPSKLKSPQPVHSVSFNSTEILDLVKSNLESEITQMREQVASVKGNNSTEVLRELYRAFHTCRSCRLNEGRNHFVFGEGPPDAKLMFVGEGPGFDEDRLGRPFVGKAGQLLERIINAMGYKRDEVFIANIVKCRPPNNRTPHPDEMRLCGSILKRQVEAIKPELIIALGKTSLGYFKGENLSIMRLRGKVFEWEGIRVMPTYHPAYVLRNPSAKRDVWEDMKAAMALLKGDLS